MSAMDQMLAGMLKSVIPPEVMEMITPDKIQAFVQTLNDYIEKQNEFQSSVMAKLEELEGKIEYARGYGKRSGNNRDSSGSDNGSCGS